MAGGELTSPSREPELLTSRAPRPRPTLQAHDVAKKSVRTLPVLHRGCGVHRWMRKQAVQLMVKRVGGGGNAHERTRTSENELHEPKRGLLRTWTARPFHVNTQVLGIPTTVSTGRSYFGTRVRVESYFCSLRISRTEHPGRVWAEQL